MPLFGQLELTQVGSRIATLRDLDTEAWTLPRAEILQLAWEVPRATQALLPRAMHPAIPTYATILITQYPESRAGPFLLAQLRLMGRAGAHPRGYVLRAVATSDGAVSALRERWGFPAERGSVVLRRRHDRVTATVTHGGVTILDVALVDPEPISGGDVQYIHSVTLANVRHEGRTAPHLVQVDPHYTLHKAERGRPVVTSLDTDAWGAGPFRLQHPISATMTTCDTDLPRIRFIMDPDIPVVRGTRRIRD
jgi:hypothetical protein